MTQGKRRLRAAARGDSAPFLARGGARDKPRGSIGQSQMGPAARKRGFLASVHVTAHELAERRASRRCFTAAAF